MLKALVADDNPVNRRLGSMLCRRAGYEALEVDSGERLLRVVELEKYAFALIDLHMPAMGGLELCRCLRGQSHLHAMKLIAYAGTIPPQEELESWPFDAVLRKPADYQSFRVSLLAAGISFASDP